VALADDLTFTSEEFNHLKECGECFNLWRQFIRAAEAESKPNADGSDNLAVQMRREPKSCG
jgi:hypothetical protein